MSNRLYSFAAAAVLAAACGIAFGADPTADAAKPGAAKPAEALSVQAALASAQAAVAGRGRAFLRPSGTEPVVRVTVEADDETLMQDTLVALAEAVRVAAQ